MIFSTCKMSQIRLKKGEGKKKPKIKLPGAANLHKLQWTVHLISVWFMVSSSFGDVLPLHGYVCQLLLSLLWIWGFQQWEQMTWQGITLVSGRFQESDYGEICLERCNYDWSSLGQGSGWDWLCWRAIPVLSLQWSGSTCVLTTSGNGKDRTAQKVSSTGFICGDGWKKMGMLWLGLIIEL